MTNKNEQLGWSGKLLLLVCLPTLGLLVQATTQVFQIRLYRGPWPRCLWDVTLQHAINKKKKVNCVYVK